MDFSYKNNPILYQIAKRNLGDELTYMENRKQWRLDFRMNLVKDLWTEFSPYFKQIYYLEKKFAEAISTKGVLFEDKHSPKSLLPLRKAAPCEGATLLLKNQVFCLYADPVSYIYCLFVFYQNKVNKSLVLTTGFYVTSRNGPTGSLHIHTVGGRTLFIPYEANNYCHQMCANFKFLKDLPDKHKTILPAFGQIDHAPGQVLRNTTNMNIILCGTMSPSKIIPLTGSPFHP